MKIVVTQRKIKAQNKSPEKNILSKFTDLFQVKSDEKTSEFDGL